ncbi:hypothetical protein BHU11_01625 [Tannerella sp. oral taxon 808]|nr:hypothetical protein BHU11_01625 [Tannerella sp. oral taxon 808]
MAVITDLLILFILFIPKISGREDRPIPKGWQPIRRFRDGHTKPSGWPVILVRQLVLFYIQGFISKNEAFIYKNQAFICVNEGFDIEKKGFPYKFSWGYGIFVPLITACFTA